MSNFLRVVCFYKCTDLNTLNLTGFDTCSVTNMSMMFADCYSITGIVGEFDTQNVTSFSDTFYNCHCLNAVNLISSFETDSLTNMYGMFCGCHTLKNIDLSGFDVKNVIKNKAE